MNKILRKNKKIHVKIDQNCEMFIENEKNIQNLREKKI